MTNPICFLLIIATSILFACKGQTDSNEAISANSSGHSASGGCLIEDRLGNLWFCSVRDGVYKYDGKTFTNYTENHGLSSNFVYSILEDYKGVLWFATADGITKFDDKTFSAIPITKINPNIFVYQKTKPDTFGMPNPIDNAVFSILQDSKGVLWFGGSQGIYLHDPAEVQLGGNDVFRPFRFNDSIKFTSGGLSIEALLEDRKGNIWFGGRGVEGAHCFDGATLKKFNPDGVGWIRPVFLDNDGTIWFARRRNAMYRYDGKKFMSFGEQNFTDWVFSMAKDKNGNLWFSNSTHGGVSSYDGESMNNFSRNSGFCFDGAWSILADKDRNVWFSDRKPELCRYDGLKFENFKN